MAFVRLCSGGGVGCTGGFITEEERTALVREVSSSVDRTVRLGVTDAVANPLAKLVVNTARQVVVDPLQVMV